MGVIFGADSRVRNAVAQAAKTDVRIAARVEQCVTATPMAFDDLNADPGQRNNLIVDERHAARIARMTDQLVSDMKRSGDPQTSRPFLPVASPS